MAIPLALIGMIPSIINLFTGETSRTDSVIDLAKKAGEALGMENATPEDVLKHIEQNPDAVVKLKELEFNAKALENEHLRKQVEESNRHEEQKRGMATITITFIVGSYTHGPSSELMLTYGSIVVAGRISSKYLDTKTVPVSEVN